MPIECLNAHSVRKLRISQNEVWAAFEGIVIDASLLDARGAALNAGRPADLRPGRQRQDLPRRAARLADARRVPVPHAICAAGEVIQIYDPIRSCTSTRARRPAACRSIAAGACVNGRS